MVLQLEWIDEILVDGRIGIVEVLFIASLGSDERITGGVARQSDARLPSFSLGFHFICALALVINSTKVGDNNRNRKSDHQHAT